MTIQTNTTRDEAEDALTPAPLRAEEVKKSGYYWWRKSDDDEWTVVFLEEGPFGPSFGGPDGGDSPEEMGGIFYGPLEPPAGGEGQS